MVGKVPQAATTAMSAQDAMDCSEDPAEEAVRHLVAQVLGDDDEPYERNDHHEDNHDRRRPLWGFAGRTAKVNLPCAAP